MINKTKIYKIYGFVIKASIIILAFWFIYRRLFVKENLDNTIRSFKDDFNQPSFIKAILLVIGLMIVNWSLETIKWKYLIRKIENVSFVKAFIAILSGVTVSIFTPNRVGEFAGRVFVLEKADRWEGVLITMIGSVSQLFITIIAGSIAFIFFANEYIDINNSPEYYFYGLVLIIFILIIILLLLFFNVFVLTNFINRLPGKLKKISHYGRIFSLYSNLELSIVLGLSLARFIVFITQFFLLLHLFKIAIPYNEAIILISMIYLVMAAIPTIALTELGVRGSVSLYFISLYFTAHNPSGQSDVGIIAASSMLWIINLVIPSIVGAIFVFRLKFFRKS